ncbi:class I SAM-dependent methyltransferase [Chitinivibrio alkaliphilus]|uniref:S-adenosylmethionine-dependent methyltransferase n=1 Tax=Chitinivibrio alkaliphilus ACht1 TaxID=1313304 RepID=U7D2X8_9BACT|nr:class I SAM-dependent methyltransferase [Chitinivibrio alkaliphilus]ERP30829.1 S-adenosylmethionine-dependent methyltransferase [Chitinivibrio alkaliphilus ACht1]
MTIFTESFWIDQWNQLNATRSSQRGWANAAVWNSMAESYGSRDESWRRARKNEVQKLVDQGIIFPGAKVLDIGCGPGSHGIFFAEAGCEVVAVDISEKMIERFESEIPAHLTSQVECRVCNWHEMDPDQEKFTRAFDLVFANMTPAIGSADDLMRLIHCSRGWCHWAGWAGVRRDFLMEDIRRELSIGNQGAFEGNALYVFNLLVSKGYFPDLSFTERNFTRDVSVEKMTEQAAAILSTESHIPAEELRPRIATYLRSIACDGVIQRKSMGRSGAMRWAIN